MINLDGGICEGFVSTARKYAIFNTIRGNRDLTVARNHCTQPSGSKGSARNKNSVDTKQQQQQPPFENLVMLKILSYNPSNLFSSFRVYFLANEGTGYRWL